MNPNPNNDLTDRFQCYLDQGHLVLTATLSTYVTSDAFARSEAFRSMWNKHFMEKVYKRLPVGSRETTVDYEYIIQCSPDGYWHFHGFLATPAPYADRLWTSSGLNRHLRNDLESFRRAGIYRPCRVNSFLVEPVEKIVAWSIYSTREPDSTSSFL